MNRHAARVQLASTLTRHSSAGLSTAGSIVPGHGEKTNRWCVAAILRLRRSMAVAEKVHANDRGALTKPCLGSVMFELVHDEPGIHAVAQ